MRIVTILGSPRVRGNTSRALAAVEARLAPEHEVERINITEHTVNGCRGCEACQRVRDVPGCVQKDDAPALFERLMAADAIVYATPIYSWGFTAQLKALIDRHYCLTKWEGDDVARSLLAGKRVALLVTCAGDAADNADLIQVAFERQMACGACEVVGQYVIDRCTTPDEVVAAGEGVIGRMAADLLAMGQA